MPKFAGGQCRLPAAAKPAEPGSLGQDSTSIAGGQAEGKASQQRVAARAWEWRGCDPIPDNILIALGQAQPAA